MENKYITQLRDLQMCFMVEIFSFCFQVNDIDHDPEEEDSDEEFALLQDIDDEELGALLDTTTSKDALYTVDRENQHL